jgi:GT2 family glycosyltransferase
MNQALSGSDAPVLIALNPDTEPAPGSLTRLVRDLDSHPGAGVVVPQLRNSDGSLQHSVYRFPSLGVAAAVCFLPARWHRGRVGRRFWLEGGAPHDRSSTVYWAIGAVHCLRAAAVEEPPYRERWFMYVEDLDLCWRLREEGWSVWFDADVAVAHVGNASGQQAWGEDRTGRWLEATYDWYILTQGPVAARAWAAANASGMAVKMGWAYLGLALRLPGRDRRRTRASEARRWAGLHGRKLVHLKTPLQQADVRPRHGTASTADTLRGGADQG